jgi:hypothetical protein
MIRQPPANVPSAIAVAAATITQVGVASPRSNVPLAISASVMTPSSSGRRWCRATARRARRWRAARAGTSRGLLAAAGDQAIDHERRDGRHRERQRRSHHGRDEHLAHQPVAQHRVGAGGDQHGAHHPPITACDEEEGSPSRQVIKFQKIPPSRPAKTIVAVIAPPSTMSSAIVAATFQRQERADEVEHRREGDGGLGR